MLTQRHRVAIRRHLGVPFAGTAQAGRLFGWRFAIHIEDLEYKLSNLTPNEEQLITGNAMGSWNIGDLITAGDVLTFTVTDGGGPHVVTYTVQPGDVSPAPNPVNPPEASPSFYVAMHAANALNQALNPLGYTAAGVMPADLFSPQFLAPYFAEVVLTAPGSSAAFTMAASVTGTTNFVIGQTPSTSPIAASLFGKQNPPTYGYVAVLDALGMGMAQAELSMWLTKADVVDFRADEVKARKRLYRTYCEMLSRDLGGKEYVEHFFGGKGGGGAVA